MKFKADIRFPILRHVPSDDIPSPTFQHEHGLDAKHEGRPALTIRKDLMVATNLARSFVLTLRHEGGDSDQIANPGGATNLAVMIGMLSSWLGSKASMAEVPRSRRRASP